MTDSTRLCGKPVAWGAVSSDGGIVNMMRTRSAVAAYVVDGTPIVPLYLSPTLTDEEREALRRMLPTIMYEPHKKVVESILARFG